MPYKISGALSDASRIIVIKESDWSIESNTEESSGAYEVENLISGYKTIVARKSDGESMGYGNTTPEFYYYYDEDCSDISDWTDSDIGTGVSSQTTFDSKSCFKFDTGASTGDKAERYCDVGSFGNYVRCELSLNHDALGTMANGDSVRLSVQKAGVQLNVLFATDGLFIYDGATWNEVGTNLVQEDAWQTWIFACDFSTPAASNCDVYLNGDLKESSVDCSQTGSYTEGKVLVSQNGQTTANRISYLDYIKLS